MPENEPDRSSVDLCDEAAVADRVDQLTAARLQTAAELAIEEQLRPGEIRRGIEGANGWVQVAGKCQKPVP